jgi:hypothetical protein
MPPRPGPSAQGCGGACVRKSEGLRDAADTRICKSERRRRPTAAILGSDLPRFALIRTEARIVARGLPIARHPRRSAPRWCTPTVVSEGQRWSGLPSPGSRIRVPQAPHQPARTCPVHGHLDDPHPQPTTLASAPLGGWDRALIIASARRVLSTRTRRNCQLASAIAKATPRVCAAQKCGKNAPSS